MKRRVLTTTPDEGGGKLVHAAALESVLFCKLHQLVAHCSVTKYDDGTARRTGWWTVKTIGQIWVVQLKDPDAAASLPCTGATLDDALVLADLMLQTPDAPWEPDPFLMAPRNRKK